MTNNLALFNAIAKLLPHPLLLCSGAGRILAANPAARRAAAALCVDGDLLELAANSADMRARLAQWLRSGNALPGSLILESGDGHKERFRCHGARATWWQGPEPAVQVQLSRTDHADQFVALTQQVRQLDQQMAYRAAAEAQRERLLRREREARERMQRLYRLTAALAAGATLNDVCDAVHKSAPQALEAGSATLELHSHRIVPSLGPADVLSTTAAKWADLDALPDGDPAASLGPEPRRVPLEAEGVTLGHLVVHGAPDGSADDEHTTAIAQQIAQAVRRAGLFEHEHRLAERLQRSLLPTLPTVEGLDIASAYAPGTHMVNVGGDWYDIHVLDDETIGLTIGDVAGHGIAEATAMAQISAALRSIARRCGHRPPEVLAEVNDFLNAYHQGLMATACYATYNRRTRILSYSRAGHPPPLLIGADGVGRYLDAALAPPLGPVPTVRYTQEEVEIVEGDVLVLYTDGLIERRREALDVGLERLTQLSLATVGLSAQETCGLFLHQQVDTEMPDDRALLVTRFAR